MEWDMTVELKHVGIDEIGGIDSIKLVEIAKDCDTLKAAVLAELKRQKQEREDAIREATGEAKRGPKAVSEPKTPKAKKSAREAEIEVALDDAEPATISGNA
jgi:carbamoylphosphate synthase small subunit